MCQVGLPVDAMEGNILEPEDSRASPSATSFNAVCQFKKKGHVTGGLIKRRHVRGGHVIGGQVTGGNVTGGQVSGGHVRGGQVAGGHVTGGHVTGGQFTHNFINW